MVTIKVDEHNLKTIENDFKDFIVDRNIGYILFYIQTKDYIITAYDNKKGKIYKVTIQGEDPMPLAKKYSIEENIMPKKQKVIKESPIFIDVDHQIGSDEVGTGDFLAPIVVCAAYVDNSTMQLIKEFNVHDSKKVSDSVILKVVPTILKKIHYSCKILSNDKYNHLVARGLSMNAIKAILHNACLTSLHKRCPYVNNIYVDKFCEEDKYYFYISTQEQKTTNIVFKEKGETFFPSIALASWVARYYLLTETKNLSTKLKMEVPLGASKTVDEFVTNYLKSHTLDDLKLICKTNFANFKNLLEVKLF